LFGEVDSVAERDHATELAEAVTGVRDVHNDLVVAREPMPPPSVSSVPPADETPAAPPEKAPAPPP
jgi:hypothetical protein